MYVQTRLMLLHWAFRRSPRIFFRQIPKTGHWCALKTDVHVQADMGLHQAHTSYSHFLTLQCKWLDLHCKDNKDTEDNLCSRAEVVPGSQTYIVQIKMYLQTRLMSDCTGRSVDRQGSNLFFRQIPKTGHWCALKTDVPVQADMGLH